MSFDTRKWNWKKKHATKSEQTPERHNESAINVDFLLQLQPQYLSTLNLCGRDIINSY